MDNAEYSARMNKIIALAGTVTNDQFLRMVDDLNAEKHAADNPDGCGPHGCAACIARLNIQPVECPGCGRELYPAQGKIPPHKPGKSDRRIRGLMKSDCHAVGYKV